MKCSELSPLNSFRLRVKVSLWLSWLNTSVSKQTTQAYTSMKHKYIKHIKKWTIYACKIYKHKRERERKANANTGELFRGSSTLVLRHRLQHYEGFYYNNPARSLGAATPTTSSLKNSWTRKSLTCPARITHTSTLGCWGRTSIMSSLKNSIQRESPSSLRPSTTPQMQGVEHLVIYFSWPLKTISQIRIL